MTIGKSNKDLENDNYFPEKKCLLIGGREIYDQNITKIVLKLNNLNKIF